MGAESGTVDSTVVIRRTSQQRLLFLGTPLLWLAFGLGLFWWNASSGPRDPHFDWWLTVWIVLVLWVLGATVVGVVRPMGVELRTDGLVVVGRYRERLVPWSDITAVSIRRTSASVRSLTVSTADHTTGRLHAPYDAVWLNADPRFEEKAGMVRSWWVAYRGEGFEAPPPPKAAS